MGEDERDFCGAMDDIPAAPGGTLPDKLFFNPDDYLVGRLHKALAQAGASGRPHVIAGLQRLIGSPDRSPSASQPSARTSCAHWR
jgi:hypothetical protein